MMRPRENEYGVDMIVDYCYFQLELCVSLHYLIKRAWDDSLEKGYCVETVVD